MNLAPASLPPATTNRQEKKHFPLIRACTTASIFLILLIHTTLRTPVAEAFFFHDLVPDPNMRAWTCHGRSQRDMVDRLCQANIIQSNVVRQVMYQVDRGNYYPSPEAAYQDAPQSIGQGQTISAPHMHAHALEELAPYLKDKIQNDPSRPLKMLDVGSGSGYLTACLGRWVKPKEDEQDSSSTRNNKNILGAAPGSQVFGIDVHRNLIDASLQNIQRQDSDLLRSRTVSIELGDGWKGLPEEAPFDAIHVGAAAAEFPTQLCQQLSLGGVMIIPVGRQNDGQALYKVVRVAEHDTFRKEDFFVLQLMGVRYVPLVHPNFKSSSPGKDKRQQ